MSLFVSNARFNTTATEQPRKNGFHVSRAQPHLEHGAHGPSQVFRAFAIPPAAVGGL